MILSELRSLQRDAAEAPEASGDEKRTPLYRAGYAAGYQDALAEAIEIAEYEEDE